MKNKVSQNRIRINEGIRAPELRIIDNEQGNLGVMSSSEALKIAEERGLDLIEVSPNANPPVAKIMDYGKYSYDLKKKAKEIKANATKTAEVKNIQIKVGTGGSALEMKANRADNWLKEGHRVKVEMFLRGRAKYIDKEFINSKLYEFIKLFKVPVKIVDDIKKSSVGVALIIEPDKSAIAKTEKVDKVTENKTKSDSSESK